MLSQRDVGEVRGDRRSHRCELRTRDPRTMASAVSDVIGALVSTVRRFSVKRLAVRS